MAVQKGRWATILNNTGEVTNISLMEGGAPEVNKDAVGRYTMEEVGPNVMIGMMRGGPLHATDGYGFPEGADIGGRAGPGSVRLSVLRNDADDAALPAVSHEKQRGTDAQAEGTGGDAPTSRRASSEQASDTGAGKETGDASANRKSARKPTSKRKAA
jgi:hypothetical protein